MLGVGGTGGGTVAPTGAEMLGKLEGAFGRGERRMDPLGVWPEGMRDDGDGGPLGREDVAEDDRTDDELPNDENVGRGGSEIDCGCVLAIQERRMGW